MTKRYYIRQDAAVLFLILIAWLCRMAHVYECPYQLELGYLRSVIYMAIPACWSVSIGRRVIQPQLRIYLIAEAWLMVFWIGVRFIKYSFVEDPCLTHWLWYLFYVSQIMMPTVSLFVSEALCKPETHRTPKRLHYLYLPALLLLALVLTNDLHQMVFVFPADGPRYPTDGYGYGIGFYLIDGWIIGCAAVTFAAILRKSRIPGIKKRILIPMGILTVLIIYLVLYILYVPFIKKWLNDVTVMFCLFLMAVFESFFRLNLIQTNTHYRRLFQITPTPACIVDGDGRQLAASDAYSAIPGDAMHRAEVSPVILQDRMRVSSAPIRIGHVVWEEDMTELLEQIRDLKDTAERLEGSNAVAAEEYRTRLRQSQLIERNRMYDKMQTQAAGQVRELGALVEALGKETDAAKEQQLLKRIGVLGAYIKRRNNLLFLSENGNALAAAELLYCIRESLQNLPVFGIFADQYFTLKGMLRFDDAVGLYDGFEQVLEASLDTLTEIFVSVTAQQQEAVLTVRLCGELDPGPLNRQGLRTLCEEPGEWIVTLSVPLQGGEPQ